MGALDLHEEPNVEFSPEPATSVSPGKFQPIVKLGQGGMAEVYLALANGPAGFNKLLVLKLLREDLAEDPEILQMFLDEARLAARLEHENLVHTYETGKLEGRYFIAMEYLQGQSLIRLRRRLPNLPLELGLWIMAQALAGLHYAHELKGPAGQPLHVVHRDVSPANIMVTYDGHVKLLDFGIAKAASAESSTRVGVFKGKMGYSAPEQLRAGEVDRRADIFAAGVTLWEVLVGRRLLASEDLKSSLRQRLAGTENLRHGAEHVPEALLAICERAMARDPEERFATALEMTEAIELLLPATIYRDAPRKLSQLLSHSFQEDRARVQALTDECLREAIAARRAGLAPSLIPEMPPDWATMTRKLSTVPVPDDSSASRRAWGAAALAGVALTGALAGWVLAQRMPAPAATLYAAPTQTHRVTAAAVMAPPARPAAPREAQSVVAVTAPQALEILVETDPVHAKLLLDGAPLEQNVINFDQRAVGTVHRLVVSASGYQTLEREVTFERSARLKLFLQRVVWPAKSARPNVSALTASAEQRGETRRTLDPRDPWE